MRIVTFGHIYEVDNFSKDDQVDTSESTQRISFVKDESINGDGHVGTNCQELLRVLINRVEFLDNQLTHENNQKIIDYLRKALILFESRHLERLVDKGMAVEKLLTFSDGHLVDKTSI